MKLYMVRHGQSETNLSGCFTGWSQVNLTEKGVEDARRAGAFLQNIHFDRIYASDLIRAVQTAQNALPGCQPVQMQELREISLGELELRPFVECVEQYGEEFLKNRRDYNFVPYGGENRAKMEARIRSFLHMLEEDPCECAVAFAHAGTLLTALDVVLGIQADRTKVSCPNGSIAMFEYVDGKWRLWQWGVAGV